jgi:hypothetical protein
MITHLCIYFFNYEIRNSLTCPFYGFILPYLAALLLPFSSSSLSSLPPDLLYLLGLGTQLPLVDKGTGLLILLVVCIVMTFSFQGLFHMASRVSILKPNLMTAA